MAPGDQWGLVGSWANGCGWDGVAPGGETCGQVRSGGLDERLGWTRQRAVQPSLAVVGRSRMLRWG